jgi:hypothetical protein
MDQVITRLELGKHILNKQMNPGSVPTDVHDLHDSSIHPTPSPSPNPSRP